VDLHVDVIVDTPVAGSVGLAFMIAWIGTILEIVITNGMGHPKR